MIWSSLRSIALALAVLGATMPLAEGAGPQIIPRPVLRPATPPAAVVSYPYGRVYVMRGLANVFSRGMDKLTVELKAKGIHARVFNHSHWREFAAEIITLYRTDKSLEPIIIIGHSLGGDAALAMGNFLGTNGVPVRLIIAFDAVSRIELVNSHVAEVINYYKPNGYGQKVEGSADYRGKIVNVDLTGRKDIGHLNIDKIESLHAQVISKVLEIIKKPVTATASSVDRVHP
jgi:pimeloyl-ACP methyl ester carboxylesterase